MQNQRSNERSAVRRKLQQWLARRFLVNAYYCDDPQLAQRDVAAGFLLDEDGEYHYMASSQLDPIDRKIAAACCSVRTQLGRSVEGVRRTSLTRIRAQMETAAAARGQSLEQIVDQEMLGW
jgi:hypothetical protein